VSTGRRWAASVLAATALLGCGYLATAAVETRRFARRCPPRSTAQPAVSILTPLKGADAGLADNLRAFVAQDYSTVQLVCGVRDPADPAVAIVQQLVADPIDRDVELVVDPRVTGPNPKVANLENMLPRARHDVMVVVDADIRVRPSYLASITAPLAEPGIGLVTCLYLGRPAGGLWSRLGALHVTYDFLPSALVNERLRPGWSCYGATLAFRRDTLAAIGGFAPLRDRLADDWALGTAVRGAGWHIVLSPHLVQTVVEEPDMAALWQHELRWARTVRAIEPAGHAGSILMHPVALALLAVAINRRAGRSWGILGLSFAVRTWMVLTVARALGQPRPPLHLLMPRDLLSFAIHVASFAGHGVTWRGQRFRVTGGGRLIARSETCRE
jgi:ceramide glucosyltransferase